MLFVYGDKINNMKPSKNDLCECGSGKKYKNCCLLKQSLGYKLNLKGKNAENFVYELAQKSFFTDWCYQSPKLPNDKEICDLLIIFNEVAIIWQIKDLKLDDNNKYNEREVKKNIHQLSTACRRLFELNIPIELENPRRGKETFDPKSIKEIHLVSALLGKGEDHYSFAEYTKRQIIHTFTREFTQMVLNELDTIDDFIEYLREKERLISLPIKIIIQGGEQELLAYYLMNQRNFDQFIEANVLLIQEGLWSELNKKPEYLAKKKEDKISYLWDELINCAHSGGDNYELVARELARLNRFQRRSFSKAFFDAHVKAHHQKTKNTFRRIAKTNGTTYVFMFLDDPEPRTRRRNLLGTACYIARGIFKENNKVIGIATEMKIQEYCSYDFCLIELPQWTKENQNTMEELQKESGIFTKYTLNHVHEDEYPSNS